MIEVGSLATSTAVEIVDAHFDDFASSGMTQCIGSDRIFDEVPASTGLYGDFSAPADPTFSVTSLVLTADNGPASIHH